MEIRPAGMSDAGAVASVHVSSWQDAYVDQVPQYYLDALSVERRTEQWAAVLTALEDAQVFVCVTEEVVGFVCNYRFILTRHHSFSIVQSSTHKPPINRYAYACIS